MLSTLRTASLVTLCAGVMLSSCNNLSYTQRASPVNAYKDYDKRNEKNASVLGVGEPISARQMAANATVTLSGQYDVEQVMQKVAGTYNVAIRWGNGVRKGKRQDILLNNLTFDEARNYIEDVYDIQIIKEGERRLLVLPSASEPRLASFAPGNNVTLSQALRGLAEQCNYNLIITENKDQLSSIRITTNLKDVTCYDAFEALLNPQGLSLINAGDYVTIGGLPQRQWTIDLYEPERNEETTVNYSSDFSSNGGGGSSDSGGSSSGSQTASGSNKVTIKYERHLWKDLEDDLKELINNNCPSGTDGNGSSVSENTPAATLLPPPVTGKSAQDPSLMAGTTSQALAPSVPPTMRGGDSSGSGGGVSNPSCGYVRINTSVGLIQMRAPRAVLDEANDIIQRVTDIASRRLLLEARVLAVSRNRNFDQHGGFSYGRRSQSTNPATNANQQDDTKMGVAAIGSITADLARKLNAFGSSASGLNMGGFSLQNQNLDAALSLLEQYGTTYELMHPMMELMDRQRATLIDGVNKKYFIVKATTTTGTATSTAADVEERSQFQGLQFSASAQVSGNPSEPHTISLQIPITSKGGDDVPIPSGVSGSIAGFAPITATRLIDQKVRIRDGEIKVIGGLTRTLATDSESGLPILREIPALGKLANDQGITYSDVEFVVLLQVKRLN